MGPFCSVVCPRPTPLAFESRRDGRAGMGACRLISVNASDTCPSQTLDPKGAVKARHQNQKMLILPSVWLG